MKKEFDKLPFEAQEIINSLLEMNSESAKLIGQATKGFQLMSLTLACTRLSEAMDEISSLKAEVVLLKSDQNKIKDYCKKLNERLKALEQPKVETKVSASDS